MDDRKKEILKIKNNLFVTACPGAGKTKLLLGMLTNNLLEVQSDRWHVILTHTNAAAEEVRSRIEKLDLPYERVWCGTIHSFLLEWVVKKYSGAIARLNNGFRLLSSYEQRKIVFSIKKILKIEDRINLISDEHGNYLIEPYYLDLQKKDLSDAIIARYIAEKESKKTIDFDDILMLSNEFLSKNDKICFFLSKLIGNFYIDESQDSSYIQLKCLSHITKFNKSTVFIVGDNDQAIYQDLGVSIKTDIQIKEILKLNIFNVETLTGCYRSTPELVDFYRKYSVSTNDVTSQRRERGNEPKVKTIPFEQLHLRVFNLISQYYEMKGSVSGIAIIGPTRYYLVDLINKIYDISDRFVFDYDALSPLYSIRETIWHDIVMLSLLNVNVSNYSRRHYLANNIISSINELSHINIYEFKKIMNEFRSDKSNFVIWFNELWSFWKNNLPLSPIVERDYTISQINISNSKAPTNLNIYKKIINRETDVVKVSTIHGVKGEEFNYVISFGYHDGVVPHESCKTKGVDYEKEIAHRLMYVAFSRATDYMNIFIDDRKNTSEYF